MVAMSVLDHHLYPWALHSGVNSQESEQSSITGMVGTGQFGNPLAMAGCTCLQCLCKTCQPPEASKLPFVNARYSIHYEYMLDWIGACHMTGSNMTIAIFVCKVSKSHWTECAQEDNT